MVKKELLQMRLLKATPKMLQLAAADTPKAEVIRCTDTYSYERVRRQYRLFARCAVENSILKVALFSPEAMRLGGRMPVYELYIDKSASRFLTYDPVGKRWLTAKLDRLDWPVPSYEAWESWMSPADMKTVQSYLGTKEGSITDILSYQRDVRDQELLARHRKQTDPWDVDLAQVPPLPKDWEHWVSKVGIPQNYIFYQYDKKGVHSGYCTYCDKEVPIKHPHYNKPGRCPCCRHKVTYKSIGKFGRLWTGRSYVYLLQRCKDGFVIREFTAERFYRKESYQTPSLSIHEIRRVICDKAALPLRAYYWGDYKHKAFRWISSCICSPSYYAHYGYGGSEIGRVYGRAIPSLAKHELARTGLPELIRRVPADPEHYLVVLREVPLLEKISKAKLPRLARECTNNYYTFKERFGGSAATSLTGILGINQEKLKRLRAQNGGLRFLDWLLFEQAANANIPDDVAAWFCAEKIEANDLRFIQGKMKPVQIRNYIRRQMSENDMTSKEILTTWEDYLSMAARFGMDINDAIIYRVRKLKKRHDELARRGSGKDMSLRAGRLLVKFPHVEEIMQSVKKKFEYAGEDYVIVAPSCIEDVLAEGDALCHCISNAERYWDRMEQRESYLLFLRKASKPDKPYYTMEVEPNGTVRQLRTFYDRQNKDIDKARKFLLAWQKTVAKRLSEEDRMLAKASKEMREREFIQMRKDQVIIHTGDLAGKLLVDVLTADLMEAA